MFKLQSLLKLTTGWMTRQNLLGDSHRSGFTSLLLRSIPSSIRQPNLSQALDPLRKSQTTGAVAALSLLPNLLQQSKSHAFVGRGCHLSAAEMEPSRTAFARELWEMSQKEAYCALYHPFVVSMAAGSLPLESFRDYIAQDVFYLAAFAQAYGMAITNTDDQQAKDVLRRLQHHVREELDQVHLSAMQSFGLELPSAIVPNAATAAYTNFLLAVAMGNLETPWDPYVGEHSADDDGEESVDESEWKARRGRKLAAFTVAALTPCMRLYAFLGQEIKKASPPGLKLNRYVKWVETYASDDFESASIESEELLDRLASPFSGERDRETIKRLYRRAMELEIDFFAAQRLPGLKLNVPRFKSPSAASTHFILVSDFDLTCTLEDSCSVLARLIISAGGGGGGGAAAADGALALRDLEGKWQALGSQYSLDHKELMDRLLPPPQQNSEDYNPQGLLQVLEKLSDFEREANVRVVQSEFLAGLSMEALKQAGSGVPLRQGCQDLLTRLSKVEQSLEFHILSVCWSRFLVQGCFSSKSLDFAKIQSNELRFNNIQLSDGNINRRMESAVDKVKSFEKILSEAEKNFKQNQETFSVYIGDSVTDLLCLLRADIGIVIGESSSLERMAAAFGIKILPLYTGLLQQQQQRPNYAPDDNTRNSLWTKTEGVLYRVYTWNELNAFFLGS